MTFRPTLECTVSRCTRKKGHEGPCAVIRRSANECLAAEYRIAELEAENKRFRWALEKMRDYECACGCKVFDDADRNDCGCDEGCCMEPFGIFKEWAELALEADPERLTDV